MRLEIPFMQHSTAGSCQNVAGSTSVFLYAIATDPDGLGDIATVNYKVTGPWVRSGRAAWLRVAAYAMYMLQELQT